VIIDLEKTQKPRAGEQESRSIEGATESGEQGSRRVREQQSGRAGEQENNGEN